MRGGAALASSVIGCGILPIANFVGKLTCYLGDGCDGDTYRLPHVGKEKSTGEEGEEGPE